MRFSCHQCKKGYEAALAKAEAADTQEDKRHWTATANKWMSRWTAALDSFLRGI